MSTEERPKTSTVYTPGKDQEFVWSIVDKVVDGTKAVTTSATSAGASGASAVTNSVSAVGSGLPEFHSVDKNLRGKLSKLSKDHVSDWLTANGLHIYRLGFQTNEVDGQSLLAMLDFWKSDKPGYIKFAQESLGVKAPGHALRLASVLEELPAYKFEDPAATVQKRDC